MSETGNFWDGAECVNHDPEVWFEKSTERQAIAICETCPLITKCALYAIQQDEQHGVWGGLSVDQRKQLKRRTNYGK